MMKLSTWSLLLILCVVVAIGVAVHEGFTSPVTVSVTKMCKDAATTPYLNLYGKVTSGQSIVFVRIVYHSTKLSIGASESTDRVLTALPLVPITTNDSLPFLTPNVSEMVEGKTYYIIT